MRTGRGLKFPRSVRYVVGDRRCADRDHVPNHVTPEPAARHGWRRRFRRCQYRWRRRRRPRLALAALPPWRHGRGGLGRGARGGSRAPGRAGPSRALTRVDRRGRQRLPLHLSGRDVGFGTQRVWGGRGRANGAWRAEHTGAESAERSTCETSWPTAMSAERTAAGGRESGAGTGASLTSLPRPAARADSRQILGPFRPEEGPGAVLTLRGRSHPPRPTLTRLSISRPHQAPASVGERPSGRRGRPAAHERSVPFGRSKLPCASRNVMKDHWASLTTGTACSSLKVEKLLAVGACGCQSKIISGRRRTERDAAGRFASEAV